MVIVRRAAVLAILGIVGVVAAAPHARAGFVDLVLSAGRPGSADPAVSKALQFRNPSGSADVAVTELGTTDTVQAVTAGGGVFFGGAGLPVLLSLSDGSRSC
jgi:hypothetical protein